MIFCNVRIEAGQFCFSGGSNEWTMEFTFELVT